MFVEADDPTLGDAMAQLDADLGADAPAAPVTTSPDPASSTTAQPEPAPADTASETQDPAQKEPGTQATEEPPKGQDKLSAEGTEANQSRYQKNKVRLEGSWEKLNSEKAQFRSAQEALNQERANFDRERQQFAQQRAKEAQPKFTPERYEQHAGQLEATAAQLDRESKALENQGNYDAAEAKRVEAAAKRMLAGQSREYAGQLRANPPQPDPSQAQLDAKFQADQKQWWGKALVDFPAMQKPDSAEYRAMASAITPTLPDGRQNPEFNPIAHAFVESHPEAMYHLAQHAVLKSSAARVPVLEKENGELRAKVKDYEQRLAPNSLHTGARQTGPKTFKEMSEQEQEADLRQMAAQLDAGGNY